MQVFASWEEVIKELRLDKKVSKLIPSKPPRDLIIDLYKRSYDKHNQETPLGVSFDVFQEHLAKMHNILVKKWEKAFGDDTIENILETYLCKRNTSKEITLPPEAIAKFEFKSFIKAKSQCDPIALVEAFTFINYLVLPQAFGRLDKTWIKQRFIQDEFDVEIPIFSYSKNPVRCLEINFDHTGITFDIQPSFLVAYRSIKKYARGIKAAKLSQPHRSPAELFQEVTLDNGQVSRRALSEVFPKISFKIINNLALLEEAFQKVTAQDVLKAIRLAHITKPLDINSIEFKRDQKSNEAVNFYKEMITKLSDPSRILSREQLLQALDIEELEDKDIEEMEAEEQEKQEEQEQLQQAVLPMPPRYYTLYQDSSLTIPVRSSKGEIATYPSLEKAQQIVNVVWEKTKKKFYIG